MALKDERIEGIVKESGLLDEEKINQAKKTAESADRPLTQVLIEKNLVKENKLSQLIAKHFGVDYVDLKEQRIDDKILNYISEDIARSYEVVPFDKKGETLYLALRDPKDLATIDLIRKETGLNIKPFYVSKEGLIDGLNQYQKDLKKQFDKIIKEVSGKKMADKDLEEAAQEVPVIEALEAILRYAIAKDASDVHFELSENSLMIRSRIDGILRDTITLPTSMQPALVARIKILANLKIDEHRVPQDGRFNFELGKESVSLRVSIIPGFYGENVVLRLLSETARPMTLKELGLINKNKKIIKQMIKQPTGLVLATGPTGSGKTTTLYSILNILNVPDIKICTIEDPVEYKIKRLTQMQVKPQIGLTFAKGLRSLLRHDPDIMMVGEIRDKETAEIAIRAALTGHLVLSTLHTNSAPAAIPRLIDMGIEPYLASSTLNVVIAQRLVRSLCQKCKEKYKPQKQVLNRLKKVVPRVGDKKIEEINFYRGKGCPNCDESGYKGRKGIYEVLENTDQISQRILKKSSAKKIAKVAQKEGFEIMLQDGLKKVDKGQTTVEEILKAVRERE